MGDFAAIRRITASRTAHPITDVLTTLILRESLFERNNGGVESRSEWPGASTGTDRRGAERGDRPGLDEVSHIGPPGVEDAARLARGTSFSGNRHGLSDRNAPPCPDAPGRGSRKGAARADDAEKVSLTDALTNLTRRSSS